MVPSVEGLHILALECSRFEYNCSENSSVSNTKKVLHLSETCPETSQQYNFHVIPFTQAFTSLEKLELAGVTAEIMDAVIK